MPAASAHPAGTTGHENWPPTTSQSGYSNNVFINGKPAIKAGTVFVPHSKPGNNPQTHPPSLVEGSASVFINGGSAGRIGDDLACDHGSGDAIAEGSTNVFIGG